MHEKGRTWTKQDLIEAIYDVRRKNNIFRMPTQMEMFVEGIDAGNTAKKFGYTWEELAKELGLEYRKQVGGGKSLRHILTEERLKEMYADKGMSVHEIAKELGVHSETVRRYLQDYGLTKKAKTPEKEYLTIEDMKRRLRLKEGKEIRTKRGVLKIMSVYGCFISVIDKKGIRGSIHVQDLYAAMKKRGEKE